MDLTFNRVVENVFISQIPHLKKLEPVLAELIVEMIRKPAASFDISHAPTDLKAVVEELVCYMRAHKSIDTSDKDRRS